MDNDSQHIQREVFQTPPWTTCAARSVPEPSLDNACSEKCSQTPPWTMRAARSIPDPSLDNACSEKCSQTPPWTMCAARSVPDPSLQGSFVFELGNPDKISWSARTAEVKSVRWTTSRNELTYGKQREIETDTETLRKRLKERSRGGGKAFMQEWGQPQGPKPHSCPLALARGSRTDNSHRRGICSDKEGGKKGPGA